MHLLQTTQLRRLVLSVAALCLLATSPVFSMCAAEYFPPPDTQGGWRLARTDTQIKRKAGLEPRELDQAWEFTRRCTQNAGLLVVRHGYLAVERYVGRAGRDVHADMASTGKAYTSVACGIMLSEFHDQIPEGLNTKVFTPKYLPEAFPLDDPRRSEITLGQLLCMSAGHVGEGQAPVAVVDGRAFPLKPVPGQNIRDLDGSSLRAALWTNAGAAYSYASPAPHVASMVLRRVTRMDLREYIDERLGKPMGWGPWGYCLHRGDFTLPHANGAGSISVKATDALRFGYCLLRGGRWNGRQLVPADYVALCGRPSPHNPHSPYSLMFENNSDGHVAGAPRDAFWKSGAGGFGILIVPSLDLVIYKMGGRDSQYDLDLNRIPQSTPPDISRVTWQPIPRTPFHEGSLGGDDGLRRTLEMVCAAVRN